MSGNPTNSLSGQWIGNSTGDPDALVVMDLDRIGNRVEGYVYLYPNDKELPSSLTKISRADSFEEFEIESLATHFIPENGYIPTWPELDQHYPGVSLPRTVSAKFSPRDAEKIDISWRSELETFGSVTLHRSVIGSKSRVLAHSDVGSWDDFKRVVSERHTEGLVYRGQGSPWPLRTSFHRTNRRDLRRYVDEDGPVALLCRP